jgi:sulfate adenylyltransferase
MASGRTCAHTTADQLQVSGTQLRKWLSEGNPVPAEFSRPEVLEVLRAYYASLEAGNAATGTRAASPAR